MTSPVAFAVSLRLAFSLITVADLLFFTSPVFAEFGTSTIFLTGEESSDEFVVGEAVMDELVDLAISVLLPFIKPKSPQKPQTATTAMMTMRGVEIEFLRIG